MKAMLKPEWKEKGYIDEPVSKDVDLKTEESRDTGPLLHAR